MENYFLILVESFQNFSPMSWKCHFLLEASHVLLPLGPSTPGLHWPVPPTDEGRGDSIGANRQPRDAGHLAGLPEHV